MQLFNVFTRKEFQDENNQEKTKWYKAGVLKITNAGGRYLRLFHQPQTEFFLFEHEPPSYPVIDMDKR